MFCRRHVSYSATLIKVKWIQAKSGKEGERDTGNVVIVTRTSSRNDIKSDWWQQTKIQKSVNTDIQ